MAGVLRREPSSPTRPSSCCPITVVSWRALPRLSCPKFPLNYAVVFFIKNFITGGFWPYIPTGPQYAWLIINLVTAAIHHLVVAAATARHE